MDGSGASYYTGQPEDTLLVEMTLPSRPGHGAMQTTDEGGSGTLEGDPKEDPPAPQMRSRPVTAMAATDALVLTSTGILVQAPDGQGGWRTLKHHYPREYRDEAVVDSMAAGSFRLVFLGRHRLRFVGRIVESGEVATSQELPLLSGRHSRLGEAGAAVAAMGGLTTMLVPGDTLTLAFASTEVAPDRVRDWFLLSHGVYTSTPLPARQEPVQPLPLRFELAQNQPNPFGKTTSIRFALPVSGRVGVELFDAQGRRVRALIEREVSAGYHEVTWDRRDDSGSIAKPGVYLYRLTTGSFRDQRKMILLP